MIIPEKFTNYNLNLYGLQEYALFCLMVFNKNANQTAVKLDKFLKYCHKKSPGKNHFKSIRTVAEETGYRWLVEEFRFGNTTIKTNGLTQLVNSDLDLRSCSVQELEKIPGFGMKTSRFFILHTRRDADVACLDTHLKNWLTKQTGKVIGNSLTKNRYLELEKLFLKMAKARGMTPAHLDLSIWNQERGSYEKSLDRDLQEKT